MSREPTAGSGLGTGSVPSPRWEGSRRTIVFVAADLFVPQGSALSALDLIRAVPKDRYKLILISRPSNALRHKLSDLPIAGFHTIDPNGCMRRGFTLQLWRLRRVLICLILRLLKPSDIVIVNGWSSARLWGSLTTKTPAQKAIISHESLHYFSSDTCQVPAETYINFVA